MQGKFTFTDAKDNTHEWRYNLYESQKEAIYEGLKVFPCGVLVGQLKKNGDNYKIVNVYEFNEINLSN